MNAYAFSLETDPYFASTVLLLSGDGVDGGTTFTDQSFVARGNASFSGDAHTDTATPKFGTAAIRLDGSADALSYADSADWNFGSGNFTIDLWARIAGGANLDLENVMIAQWEASGSQRSWLLRYDGSIATNQLQFLGSSAGSGTDLTVAYNWTPTGDQYYLISVDRSSNDFRVYIDGSMVVKVTQSITLKDSTASMRIGARSNAGLAGLFHGSIDEPRITKGVARYASDSGFTVPTAAWPRN